MPKLKNKIIKSELVNWQSIKDLQPNNLKDPRNLNYLKESLVENGFSKAFDVWQSPEGEIYFVDGHTRSDVLKELVSDGYEIPEKLMCNFVDCKDRKEAVKILLEVHNQKQNKINDQVMNDWVKVEGVDIAEVSVESLNISEVFEDEENVKELEAEEDNFEVGDTNKIKTDIVLGDLFEIGEHRLLCGDSTDSDQVARLMGGEKADMVFTDPPYGIKIVGNNGKVGEDNQAKSGVYSKVIADETTDTAKEFYNTCIALGMENFIIWGGNYFTDFLPFTTSWIIWDKRGDMNSNNFADGEMAWCSFETRVRIYKQIWNGMIREGEKEKRLHPTQKPIRMLSEIIDDHVKGSLIFDGFLGSGSTMIASHQLKRKCYGMELDPKYCQVIIDRMKKLDPDLAIKKNGTVI